MCCEWNGIVENSVALRERTVYFMKLNFPLFVVVSARLPHGSVHRMNGKPL